MINNFLKRWLLVCLAAMFVLPFLWSKHSLPIPSFYNEDIAAFITLLACLTAVCLSVFYNERDKAYALPLIALIFVPLIVVLGLQLYLGKLAFAYNAIFPMLVMAVAMAAAMLGASCVRLFGLEKLLFWIAIACIVGGVYNVLAQMVQFCGASTHFLPWISFSRGSYYGNLAQRNHLATYLSWALISVLYLHAKRRLHAVGGALLAFILLTGVALTASRMTWLQVVWIALAAGYLMFRMEPAARPKSWYLVFGLPLVYFAITLVIPHIADLFHASAGFSETALDRIKTETLDRSRWLIYSQAWEIFTAHPLLGIGPGELQFNQFLLMDHYDKTLFASSAHDLFLDLLVMTGIVGTVFFLWFLGAWLLRMRRILISLETTCVLLFLSVLGIHSLLEFPQWYGFFLFPLMFLMGSLETRFITVRSAVLVRIVPAAASLYGVVFTVILYLQYMQLEALYSTMYLRNPTATAASEEGIAVVENYRASSFFKAPAEFILSWTFHLNEISVDKKLEISARAVRYQPEPNIIYRHIVLLALSGRQDEANFYLIRLRKTYPEEFKDIGKGLIDMAAAQPEVFGKVGAEATKLGAVKTRAGM